MPDTNSRSPGGTVKRPKKRRRRRRLALPIFLLLAVLIAFLFFDSNMRVAVDDFSIAYRTLPATFDGYRIAQLSDIHAAVYGSDNVKLISAVKDARPDIIVITGDLIDTDDQLDIVDPLVHDLTKIAPVYFVTGNHEWDSGAGALKGLLKVLDKDGVTVLRNAYVKLHAGKDTIVLAGVDDPNGPADMKTPEELISEIRQKEGDPFIVLLVHRNSFLDRFSRLGINLVLCGHAHGGMIRLPFMSEGLIGPSREWFPNYTGGVYTEGSTTMLVSRGVGNHTGVPRFLNNPEIPVVSLKKT